MSNRPTKIYRYAIWYNDTAKQYIRKLYTKENIEKFNHPLIYNLRFAESMELLKRLNKQQ